MHIMCLQEEWDNVTNKDLRRLGYQNPFKMMDSSKNDNDNTILIKFTYKLSAKKYIQSFWSPFQMAHCKNVAFASCFMMKDFIWWPISGRKTVS